MNELINRFAVLAGAVLLAVVGRDRFYQMAQDRHGICGRFASAFCQGHAGRVGANYSIYAENKNAKGITTISLKYYSDDSLHGFGDYEFSRSGNKPLLEQQRGLIIPLVENAIQDNLGGEVVLEIGTGNGDVIAYLADKYPEVSFIGVDLSIVNAIAKHQKPNLTFVEGYALELLREGKISGDIIFGTSTFCVFAPLEFKEYLSALHDARRIIISDPVTFGNKHEKDPKAKSRHMDLYMWWHNYFGYLTEAGMDIDHFETVNFAYSHNPNAKVVLISGKSAMHNAPH